MSITPVGAARAIHWRINCACNRRCAFCYGPEQRHEVNLEASIPVLDNLVDHGVRSVIITGGEPLLSRKVRDVLRHLRARGVSIVLYTNCDLFDQHEDVLVDTLDVLCVPLEGASEFIHDQMRGVNSMRAVVSVLDRYAVKGSPFRVKVGTVLGRHNLHELPAILYLLGKYRIEVWKLYEYVRYTDRELQKKWLNEQLGITDAEYRHATRAVLATPDRKTKISLSSDFERDNSYFMMNPDLEIVVPVRGETGEFEDRVLCNAANTPVSEIERLWRETIDWEKHQANLQASLF